MNTDTKARDPAFGPNGRGYVELGIDAKSAYTHSIRIGPDGRIYTAFHVGDKYGLAVMAEDGQLDPSFGQSGIVTGFYSEQGTNSVAQSVGLTADGKILLIGYANMTAAAAYPAIARFDAAGQLDPDFGDGGHMVITAPFETSTLSPATKAIEMRPAQASVSCTHGRGKSGWDERIYISHPYSYRAGDGAFVACAILIVLDTDGNMAPEFNNGKPLVVDRLGAITSIYTLLVEGDILFAGGIVSLPGKPVTGCFFKFAKDGQPQPGFGDQGLDWEPYYVPYIMERKDADSLLVGGTNARTGYFAALAVGIKMDGSPDPTFNGGATQTSTIAENWTGLAVQSDGKLLLVGRKQGAICARMSAAGEFDPSFGGTGWEELLFDDQLSSHASSVVLQPNKARMLVGCGGTNTKYKQALVVAVKL